MDFATYEAKIREEMKPRFVVDALLKLVKHHNLIQSERLPHKGETVAIVSSYPKTAALLYDKVLDIYRDTPKEVSVVVHTESYFRQTLSDLCSFYLHQDGNQKESKLRTPIPTDNNNNNLSDQSINASTEDYLVAHVAAFKFNVIGQYDLLQVLGEREETKNEEQFVRNLQALFEKAILRWHSENLWMEHKISATPVYCTLEDRDIVYNPGDFSIVCASLSNLEIVNENDLEWDQVMDFRRDGEASIKYRRFINWLDKDMVGKSQQFIENEIAIRLDDYNWAIKKHGIKTVIGIISHALDSKFLFSSAAASSAIGWMGDPIAGLFAMGGISVGKVAIEIARTGLAIKEEVRNINPEISYVHDIGNIRKTV